MLTEQKRRRKNSTEKEENTVKQHNNKVKFAFTILSTHKHMRARFFLK